MPAWFRDLLPIVLLLAAIAVVLARLPRIEVGHSAAFRRRRFFNWFPLGMTYAFLYMARYNLNEATSALGKLTPNSAFGTIFAIGSATYGVAFLINGPLTDRLGGRVTILLAAAGASVANALMGALVWGVLERGWAPPGGLIVWLSVLYAVNMYFQSFGAVSIVKVNANWFHLRERGQLGGVFGILISLGIYFGYDWSRMIVQAAPTYFAFFVPALILAAMLVVDVLLIQDSPSKAGHQDFDAGDASSGDDGPRLPLIEVAKRMFLPQNGKMNAMVIIIAIEFCTGFLRNGVMSWFPKFAKAVGSADSFVATNWGMLLCVAGICGGMLAGVISDRVFQSRRGPVSTVLYAGISLGAVAMVFTLASPALGWVLVFMALNYIGVHGMLSGTASADFGGKKNAGVATGIIDGFVYLGTAVQSLVVGAILPTGEAARVAGNWWGWPLAMIPFAAFGLFMATRVWNARPVKYAAKPAPAVAPAAPASVAKTGTEG